jgi:hypothetical protein
MGDESKGKSCRRRPDIALARLHLIIIVENNIGMVSRISLISFGTTKRGLIMNV